jgi:putative transcriptional regulator
MIRSKLKRLRVDKEEATGRKLTYKVISEETGLSEGVLVRLMNSNFERVETPTLNTLCRYFGVGIGELLEYVPDPSVPDQPAEATP